MLRSSRLRLFVAMFVLIAMSGVCCAESAWGLVNVSVANLRAEPSHASEMETQVVYGTPVEILDSVDEWLYVNVPDGYKAYVTASSLTRRSHAQMAEWRSSHRLIFTDVLPAVILKDSTAVATPGNVLSDVTLCSIFEGEINPGARFAEVRLPDGRTGFLPAASVADFRSWSSGEPSVDEILSAAQALNGTPYLWGGASSKAVDCSGLTQLCYLFGARCLLPRNASQQATVGEEIDFTDPSRLQPGDLLFFGNGESAKITHVAISQGGSRYIHASGRVYISSFDPADPLYIPRRVIKSVRILGIADREMSIAGNPVYF
ncbi:MAG: C40 family peptidase [Bacteroides sp.]|nr:C40 family peptidase [Bacteroides sp.]MCM1414239.1 C40 family peptidase [Bacteroides sp.]MCM1471262.1 C40 family peptidase [Bacteroides sp.]